MQVIIFQRELYACHWTTRKNICTLSSHKATRELYAKVSSHRAPVGAVYEGSMRIELRSELYAKGALCGSTELYAALQCTDARYRCSIVPLNLYLKSIF